MGQQFSAAVQPTEWQTMQKAQKRLYTMICIHFAQPMPASAILPPKTMMTYTSCPTAPKTHGSLKAETALLTQCCPEFVRLAILMKNLLSPSEWKGLAIAPWFRGLRGKGTTFCVIYNIKAHFFFISSYFYVHITI